MEKTIFEQMGATYHEENGYLIPNLTLPPEEEQPIGVWGQRHLCYLRQHRRVLYADLLTSGKLNSYLANIGEQAENIFSRLVKQMAEREGLTEEMKAENFMLWIGIINEIRARAREFVNAELIHS